MKHKSQSRFFWNMNLTVGIFVIVYAFIYFYLSIPSVAIITLLASLAFNFFAVWLDRGGHTTIARFLFIATCTVEICVTPLFISVPVHVEYYFLPVAFMSFLLFQPKQKTQMFLGSSIPLIGWTLLQLNLLPTFFEVSSQNSFPWKYLSLINFIGAYLVMAIIVYLYNFYLDQIKMESLGELNALNSELQKAENIATKKGRELQALFNGLSVGVLKLNSRGNVLQYNQSVVEILGVTESQLLEEKFFENYWQAVNSESVTVTREKFPGFVALQTGIAQRDCVLGMRRADGLLRWINLTAMPIEGDTDIGRCDVIVTLSDITELHEKTSEIQNQQKFLSNVLGMMPSLVSYIDKNYVYRYVNPQYESWFNKSMSEITGKHMIELIGEQPFLLAKPDLERAFQGEKVEYQRNMPYKNGARTISVVYLPDTGEDGTVYGIYAIVTDITQMQLAREEVEKHARQLDQFFDVALDLMCILSFDGMFHKLNPAFSKVLGYSQEEFNARKVTAFIHPDDVDFTESEFRKLAKGVLTIRFENRYLTKDGSTKILSWTASTDRDSGLIYAVARDITEVKEKESELRQTMAAIDSSAIVAITDKKGKILSINDNFCAISGYSRSELIGRDHRLINSKMHSKHFFEDMWSTIASGKVWSGEIQNKTKSGEYYFVRTVISPLKNVHGEVERYIAIRFDVTEQREIANKLEEAQSVGRVGSWTYDIVHDKLDCTKQMFELLNWSSLDGPLPFMGQRDRIHPDDYDEWVNKLELCKASGIPFRIRLRSVHMEKITWLEINGRGKLNSNGRVDLITGTCQDISELVLAEESAQVERAKSLQSAKLASLGEMSAGIAHEINNPLAIIAGNLSLLPKYTQDPEKFKQKIDTTQKACDRISKIVNGLRKFSRASEQRDRRSMALNQILIESLLLTEAKSKRYFVPIQLDLQTDGYIDCDEIEIEQVLINLISNGVDAAKVCNEKWVKITLFEQGGSVVLQVRDSGQGIEPKLAKNIFQPFFTTKPVGEGTGLGLSIVKGILDDHNATIEVLAHDPNTCFQIRFPKSKALAAAS